MKKLSFVRHAKSSWDSKYPSDFEREINERGIQKTENLFHFLKAEGLIPEMILCSPAVRAMQTAHFLMSKLNFSKDILVFEPALYSGNHHDYINAIYAFDDSINHLMVVGHNPSISDVAYSLSNEVAMMNTSEICHFEFDCTQWNQISNACILKFLSHNPQNPFCKL